MKREGALYSDTIGDMPHGETGIISAFFNFKHYTLEDLSAQSVLLPYFKAYLYGVARAYWGNIRVGLLLG